eukprot:3736498-Pleurochrysis_carterae.AAC.1
MSRALRCIHRRVAVGGGCRASNRACAACTDAAASVAMRSKRFGAYAPPNPSRLSTITPAR